LLRPFTQQIDAELGEDAVRQRSAQCPATHEPAGRQANDPSVSGAPRAHDRETSVGGHGARAGRGSRYGTRFSSYARAVVYARRHWLSSRTRGKRPRRSFTRSRFRLRARVEVALSRVLVSVRRSTPASSCALRDTRQCRQAPTSLLLPWEASTLE
jgi:hypothetical protein